VYFIIVHSKLVFLWRSQHGYSISRLPASDCSGRLVVLKLRVGSHTVDVAFHCPGKVLFIE
jgi:hypothetical protein